MKRWLALLVLPFMLFMAIPAIAVEPPESIEISNVQVYRNLAETGDFLVVFHYDMPYTSDNYSDTPASETIMLRLFDTDNTTLLQGGVPYVNPFFESNGYGDGVGSFYFGADYSPPTWEDACVVNIYGSPAFFDPAISQSYTLTESDYTTANTTAANQEELKDYVLLECDKLASDYADTGVILKATSDAGIVLSPYGELYFRGAIPGLQNLCPDLFFIQSIVPEQMVVVPYDMSLGETYAARLESDDLGEGFTNAGALIGVSGSVFAAILTFGISFVLCLWTTRKGWGTEIGMLGSALIIIAMALLVGDIVFTILMIISLVAAMGLVYLVLLKRA